MVTVTVPDCVVYELQPDGPVDDASGYPDAGVLVLPPLLGGVDEGPELELLGCTGGVLLGAEVFDLVGELVVGFVVVLVLGAFEELGD